MLGRTYDTQNCSAARTLEIVGERWSLLIIRDALFRGMSRYSEFERSLGIAPNILASRLAWFVEAGLMKMSQFPKGRNFLSISLRKWARSWEPLSWRSPHGVIVGRHRKVHQSFTNIRTVVAPRTRSSSARRVVENSRLRTSLFGTGLAPDEPRGCPSEKGRGCAPGIPIPHSFLKCRLTALT